MIKETNDTALRSLGGRGRGCHATMADGSTHFMNEALTNAVIQAINSIRYGETEQWK